MSYYVWIKLERKQLVVGMYNPKFARGKQDVNVAIMFTGFLFDMFYACLTAEVISNK